MALATANEPFSATFVPMSTVDYEDLRRRATTIVEEGDKEKLQAMIDEVAGIDEPQAKGLYLHYSAMLLRFNGKEEESLELIRRALPYYEQAGDDVGVASVYSNLGIGLNRLGDGAASIEYLNRGLETYRRLDKKLSVGKSLQNIGNTYKEIGDLSLSLRYMREAESIFRSLNNENNLAVVLYNIGGLYGALGDLEMAERYTKESIELAVRNKIYTGACVNYLSLVRYYLAEGRLEEAQAAADRSVEFAELSGHGDRLYAAHGTVAEVAVRLGDVDTAVAHIEQMPKDVTPGPSVKATYQVVRAEVLVLQGRLEEAKDLCLEAYDILQQFRFRQISVFECLLNIAKHQGDLDMYIHWHELQVQHEREHSRTNDAIRIAAQEKEREIEAERREHEKQQAVLHAALPRYIADRVAGGESVNDHHEQASVLFLDIVGFTAISDRLPSGEVVGLLERIFTQLDDICDTYGLTTIKTIGDSYMAVAGVPEPLDDQAQRAAACALEMRDVLSRPLHSHLGDLPAGAPAGLPERLEVRIGLHCGPLTAGVISTRRVQYDVWGDTVNVASRMESTGEAGRIQVSSEFHEQLISRAPSNYGTVERGTIEIKGKGLMQTYWLESA